MTFEEIKRFKELAEEGKHKNVPPGWVYVGKGKSGGLGFGHNLRMDDAQDEWECDDTYQGNSELNNYICPINTWNEKIKLSQLPEMFVVNFYGDKSLGEAILDKMAALGYVGDPNKEHKWLKNRSYILWDGNECAVLSKEATPFSIEEILISDIFTAETRVREIPECGLTIVGDTVKPTKEFSLNEFKKQLWIFRPY